jgi:SYP7 family syntaxin
MLLATTLSTHVSLTWFCVSSSSDKIDAVNDRVGNVNSRMKETLEEVGRSSDKLIVDIICIVLAIGFAAVIYNLYQSNS